MSKTTIRWTVQVLILAGILLAIAALSLCLGSTTLSIREAIDAIFIGSGATEYNILFQIRLPRIILGLAIGGALSLAGVILQGLFRNPLVEPYTMGISGGAALGVSLAIVLKLCRSMGLLTLPFAGFLGSALVIMMIYFINIRRRALKIQGLLLTGVMISFISSSLIMLVMAISRAEDLHGIIFWIMGSLEEPSWFLIKLMLFVSLAGLVLSYIFWKDLNALRLGEEEAAHLGINTERVKRMLFILASLLTGCAVSVGGIIGFVGLIVPHLVRMFIGSDHRILLVGSFLCGAGFLISCDTLARIIIVPSELPVGVITGILGGTFFIYALTRRGKQVA
ncbi:MAG: iron ABC transporter permease [Candidatus Omnitrophota bacterium]|nr:iron ABC transporter permease [Candidatus Omnitrophota bacterium]